MVKHDAFQIYLQENLEINTKVIECSRSWNTLTTLILRNIPLKHVIVKRERGTHTKKNLHLMPFKIQQEK